MNTIENAKHLKMLMEELIAKQGEEWTVKNFSGEIGAFFQELKEYNKDPSEIYEAIKILSSVKFEEEGENIFTHNQDIEFSIQELIQEGLIVSDDKEMLFNGKRISTEKAIDILNELGIMATTLKIALIFNKKYDDSFIDNVDEERLVKIEI